MLQAIIDFFSRLFRGTPGQERPSPGDWQPEAGISYDQSTGVLAIDLMKLNVNLSAPPVVILPGVPNTNSMDPVFDEGNQNILIQGANGPDMDALRKALKVGDVAVYVDGQGGYIIHRISRIYWDGQGQVLRFMGDNNAGIEDEQIVRLENIAYVSIGAIY